MRDGIEGLTNFSYEQRLPVKRRATGKAEAWVATALPRTTRQVGAWIENEFGVVYEPSTDRVVACLGLEYHKPNVIPRISTKNRRLSLRLLKLLNSLGDDEAVLFADAVHHVGRYRHTREGRKETARS